MPIKSLYTTSYLMAIVLLATSFTISKMFAVELCLILTLTIRAGNGQCKYPKREPMHAYLFNNNNIFYYICHRLQYNHM